MCKSTDSANWRPLDESEKSQVAALLRERNLHLTAQRQAVCEAVFGCPGHICAEHVLSIVTKNRPDLRTNKTTVYRTLDLLVEMGLVIEHKTAAGPAQYEPASRGHHGHLLCRHCGTLANLDPGFAESLQGLARSKLGFQLDLVSYPIVGICPGCAPTLTSL